MILIEVEYPFEVNSELGTYALQYPTLAKARQEATELFRSQWNEEVGFEEDRGYKRSAHLPATVSKVEVCKLTKSAFCEIIRTGGDSWVNGEPIKIGELRWNGSRLLWQ